ncbi:septum formation protein Maf [Weizmannia acidilactici]|uniref:Maf family protein n=1 Tax=Weizmannia acidilactici TaxID=2607726 RepID=UPI00124C2E19|nr:Maf family protein [Weizmannia acidilactici]GER66189.1 septum formation protein Maf [Weizmannia acidilactici]
MMDLILASGSPRRKELLQKLQIPFIVEKSDEDELIDLTGPPEAIVKELACRKAESVAAHFPEDVVVGADTVVALEDRILGKPGSRDEARRMLHRLSGKTHTVYTGVAVCCKGETEVFFEKTDVTFWHLSEKEIEQYMDSGEPFDKAGAYGIQGLGALFVKGVSGDYYNVVGLPVSRLYRMLSGPKYAGLSGPSAS